MLSKTPIELDKVPQSDLDKQILRIGIIAELDAINFYEQLAVMTQNRDLKKLMLDVAREEKTHIGEFQALLTNLDPEQEQELTKGKQEVTALIGQTNTYSEPTNPLIDLNFTEKNSDETN